MASSPSSSPSSSDSESFEFFPFPSSSSLRHADDIFFAGTLLPLSSLPTRKPTRPSESSSDDRVRLTLQVNYPADRLLNVPTKSGYRRLRSAPDSGATSVTSVPPRPRWRHCVLGTARVPSTTNLSEIRSRQRRRSAAADVAPENGGTWRIVRSLSCHGGDSAAVVDGAVRGIMVITHKNFGC